MLVLFSSLDIGNKKDGRLVQGVQERTLDICHALSENLLQHLGVLQLLLHLGNNGLSKLLLLTLLDLALVADPGIQNGLGLSSQGSLLLQLVGLGLELGGFLKAYVRTHEHRNTDLKKPVADVPWKPRTGSW